MKGRTGWRRTVAAVVGSLLLVSAGACGGSGRPAASKSVATTSPAPPTTNAGGAASPSTGVPPPGGPSRHPSHPARPIRGGPGTKTPAANTPGAKGRRGKPAVRVHKVPVCPLTGVRAPRGRVPRRAALAVKIDNTPQARPQWGLDKADIVFEEPVEGGITRFIAVFQCKSADRIEPVRSVRLVDAQILEPLGHVLFAYSGGIQPAVNEVDERRSSLGDVGGYKAGDAYWRDPTRYEPHNLETSAAALYGAAKTLAYRQREPRPIFSYGRPVKGGTPAASVNIHFALDTTTWTYNPRTGTYYRSYSDTGPAMQGDGNQITASNVVIMKVREWPTPWPEDETGALENELTLKGSGPAWVFRDGLHYYGFWERSKLARPAVFYNKSNGFRVRLTPGNTWVELVPYDLNVSVRP